ncbi:hypothetical protein E1281_25280 [Actinomadura sp. KC345]|uniref:hypothetical protein n=1 Tax=Actinomadura sp. KC345 TaxID=2530371 RepID=UPI00104CB61A|nr:hypothetical protein [Actinomadura sp. KC345]TDC48059.1 hypothetical protein E1281_25280 [Actinomadura sp. KC345]
MRPPMSKGARWARVAVLHVLGGLCVVTLALCISAAFFHTPSPSAVGMTAGATSAAALLLLVAVLVPRVRRLIGIRDRFGEAESWATFRKELFLLLILPALGNRLALLATELIAALTAKLVRDEQEGTWWDLLGVALFVFTIACFYVRSAQAVMFMRHGRAAGPGLRPLVVGFMVGGLLYTAFSILAVILLTLVGLAGLMWQVLIASTLVNAMTLLAALIVLRPVDAAKS